MYMYPRLNASLTVSFDISESGTLTTGDEGKQFRIKAWEEILDVLRFQAKEIEIIVRGGDV